MLRNHFKFALRNLWRDKTYSLINILGLSVALASCFIILLYSVHELSYDRYNKKLDRVYMLTMNFGLSSLDWTQPLVPFPAGPTLKADAPEVERFVRCSFRSCSVGYGRRTIHSVQCVSADSSIFKILSLPVVSGNLGEAFAGRNYVVISRGLAEKIFGVGEVVGHVIDVNWAGEEYHLTVGAVIANIPSTSTFRADCILPMFLAEQSIKKMFPDNPDVLNAWMPGVINTYLLLSNNKSAEQLRKKLIGFSKEHSTIPSWPLKLHLVPLKDVYFRPATVVNTYPIPRGNLSDVEIYSLVAILTLLTACVNFVVLSTGRASVRTKEIGVRKVIGASRFDIAGQVMVESATVFVLSLPIALVLVEIFMPSLTTLLGKRLPSTDSRTLGSVIVYLIVTFLAGVFSGSYLSFYLSGLHPAEILRKRFNGGRGGASLRKVLLSFQMIIFVGLILASITIYRQTRYFHTKDMGFNDKNLVVFSDLSQLC